MKGEGGEFFGSQKKENEKKNKSECYIGVYGSDEKRDK